jgi:hypothetical protein
MFSFFSFELRNLIEFQGPGGSDRAWRIQPSALAKYQRITLKQTGYPAVYGKLHASQRQNIVKFVGRTLTNHGADYVYDTLA